MLRCAQHDRWLVIGVVVALVTAGAVSLLGLRWLRATAAVPDHATALSASAEMKVAGQLWLAQVVRPDRDGLAAVDVLLAAEQPGLPGEVVIDMQELPGQRVLRTSRRRAADLPAGSAWDYRPGSPRERWVTFGFDPIPDSAGKELRVVLTYGDGRDAAGERVAALARFPQSYRQGTFYVNGFEAGGTLLLRLAAAGTRGQAVGEAATNLARQQPLARGTLVVPAVLGVLCLVLAGAVAANLAKR